MPAVCEPQAIAFAGRHAAHWPEGCTQCHRPRKRDKRQLSTLIRKGYIVRIFKAIEGETKANTMIRAMRHIELSGWARGGWIGGAKGRFVPGARPAALRAGARKLADVATANLRRELRAQDAAEAFAA